MLESLGTNIPKVLPKNAKPAESSADHPSEERVVEPVDWPRLARLPHGALRVQLLGDSLLVCSWVNGDWDCLNKCYKARLGALQRVLHAAWTVGTLAPLLREDSWACHVYRENNKVADATADRGCKGEGLEIKMSCARAREIPQGVRAFFDGTGGKSASGTGGAGWVLYACFAYDIDT